MPFKIWEYDSYYNTLENCIKVYQNQGNYFRIYAVINVLFFFLIKRYTFSLRCLYNTYVCQVSYQHTSLHLKNIPLPFHKLLKLSGSVCSEAVFLILVNRYTIYQSVILTVILTIFSSKYVLNYSKAHYIFINIYI